MGRCNQTGEENEKKNLEDMKTKRIKEENTN